MKTQDCPISFWQGVKFWFKLGMISFGGPAGQIAILHQELVETRRWISEKRFLHALNYCMLLPGPEAQQLATYIGWLMHGTRGGIVAGVLFVLPSLVIMIVLAWLYSAYGEMPIVSGILFGIKPAVTALVVHAAMRIGKRVLKNFVLAGIAASSFLALFVWNVAFPVIIMVAALVGYLGGRLRPEFFSHASAHSNSTTNSAPAIIDDDSPRPAHTRFNRLRLAKVVIYGALLWSIPMVFLQQIFGWEHPLCQMAWFFTKAALLTFGGAYAVLPYVAQATVLQFAWLSPNQMLDGLALGETTPGPLIIIVAFVGFVAAYGKAFFGPEHVFLAGAVAATVVTWNTFLPSFLFILAGGPLVEASQNTLKFNAPLIAISAAVVGVIANLALFFSGHLFWPSGFSGNFDMISGLLALLSAIALIHYQRSVIQVIAAAALSGVIIQSLM